MNELASICNKKGYSFMVLFDNHKRFKQTVEQYIQQMNPELLKSDDGKQEVAEMVKQDTIVIVDVYNNAMVPLFVVHGSCIDHAIQSAMAGIETNLKMKPGDEPIFLLQA